MFTTFEPCNDLCDWLQIHGVKKSMPLKFCQNYEDIKNNKMLKICIKSNIL